MNADAGNLPDMLRSNAVVAHMARDEWRTDEYNIEDELAALVEAADKLRHVSATDYDVLAYDDARAALVAKIGGKG